MEDKIHISLEMQQQMSNEAKKIFPEYHQLKLQIRFYEFDKGKIDDLRYLVLDYLTKNLDSVNKIQELNTGADLFIRYYGEMNKIISLLEKKYYCVEKRSKKLVGKDNLGSVDVYRYTQCIDLINLEKGDTIIYKGEEYTLKGINKKELILIHKITGAKSVYTYHIIRPYTKIIKK